MLIYQFFLNWKIRNFLFEMNKLLMKYVRQCSKKKCKIHFILSLKRNPLYLCWKNIDNNSRWNWRMLSFVLIKFEMSLRKNKTKLLFKASSRNKTEIIKLAKKNSSQMKRKGIIMLQGRIWIWIDVPTKRTVSGTHYWRYRFFSSPEIAS